MSYAAAASGNTTRNFIYNRNMPLNNQTRTVSGSPKRIQVQPSLVRSVEAMQAAFDVKNTALNALNTSAELDAYQVTSVDRSDITYRHGLTYFERADQLKGDEKSRASDVKILRDEVALLRAELQRGRDVLQKWETIGRILEGSTGELWESLRNGIRVGLIREGICNYFDLRYFARRPNATPVVINAYQSIPHDLHDFIDQMVAEKHSLQPTSASLAHVVSKADFRSLIQDGVVRSARVTAMLARVETRMYRVDGEDLPLFN